MKVYIVSSRMFFLSGGIDYAAAVDMNADVRVFTSRRKAEREFDGLVARYSQLYGKEPKVVNLIGFSYRSTEIADYGRRMVVEMLEKDTA